MKKIFFSTLCALTLAFTGCTTYQYGARQANINRHDIEATPTVVDVKPDFSKRIEVTSSWQKTKEDAMAECQYMAITNYKVDIVVDPIYRLEVRRRKCKATLVGFGGYYINPRTQYEDIQAIQRYSRDDIEKYLILHHTEVLKYMNAKGEVVNIYHNDHNCAPKPMPKPEEEPAQQPANKKKK